MDMRTNLFFPPNMSCSLWCRDVGRWPVLRGFVVQILWMGWLSLGMWWLLTCACVTNCDCWSSTLLSGTAAVQGDLKGLTDSGLRVGVVVPTQGTHPILSTRQVIMLANKSSAAKTGLDSDLLKTNLMIPDSFGNSETDNVRGLSGLRAYLNSSCVSGERNFRRKHLSHQPEFCLTKCWAGKQVRNMWRLATQLYYKTANMSNIQARKKQNIWLSQDTLWAFFYAHYFIWSFICILLWFFSDWNFPNFRPFYNSWVPLEGEGWLMMTV